MRKSLVIVVAFCGAALLSAAGVVAQTDASVIVTPGRASQFLRPDPSDARTVITPGPSEMLVNPHLRGRRGPENMQPVPRAVPVDDETGTSIHPGSRPIVVYPEADAGGTVVIPGRRPVVVYPPIP